MSVPDAAVGVAARVVRRAADDLGDRPRRTRASGPPRRARRPRRGVQEQLDRALTLAESIDRRGESVVELGSRIEARSQAMIEIGERVLELGDILMERSTLMADRAKDVADRGADVAALPTLQRAVSRSPSRSRARSSASAAQSTACPAGGPDPGRPGRGGAGRRAQCHIHG